MEIVVTGRNVEVPDHYRVHVAQKMARLERYDRKGIRFDVVLYHEPNRRQAKNCQHVEITAIGRGPVTRAEAAAADFYSALDGCVARLEARLRKAADRRRVHHGRHNPISVAEATAPNALRGRHGRIRGRRVKAAIMAGVATPEELEQRRSPETPADVDVPTQRWSVDDGDRVVGDFIAGGFTADGGVPGDDTRPGQVGPEMERPAKPMTVDEALSEMELQGHDFCLFADAESGRPSVVYRRKGFEYGVVRLSHS